MSPDSLPAASPSAPPTVPPSRAPHTLLILLAACIVAAVLVPWVPAGYFDADVGMTLSAFRWHETPVAVSAFASDDSGRGVINALFEGLTSGGRESAAVGVIAFVLLVGGAFGVVRATGAVDRSVMHLSQRASGMPRVLLAALLLMFSLGGAVFGMGEETIAFLALLLPLVRRLGYPPEVAVMITYMGSQIGFATSWMNPFSVAVAQGIADLPLLSGAPLRLGVYAVFVMISIVFVLRWAGQRRVTTSAPVDSESVLMAPLRRSDRLILLAVVATVAWIVWGVVAGGYYIPQIASQFVALGMVSGLIAVLAGTLRANAAAEAFVDGARDLLPAALVIAMAKGLLYLLGGSDPHQPSLLNTLLFGMGSALDQAPELVAAEGMLLAQSVFNLFVTSGSAQAAITMPLMAGLSDLVGVTRQVAVLAFQLGDGLTNLVVPTSAALMGALGVAGISWTRWIAVIWKFQLLLLVMAAVAVAVAVLTGYR